MRAMKREKARRVIASVGVLGIALAAVAFYAVRDLLAAFVLFSVIFVALAAALLLIISAEEALVWGARWIENCLGRIRARHFALAGHAGAQHSGFSNHG